MPTAGSEPLHIAHFQFDSADLSPADRRSLGGLISELGDQPLAVIGFTDDVGTRAYNAHLALRRAEAVKRYLISLGLSPEAIDTEARGKCCYRAPNDSAAGRGMNRRAEVHVRPAGSPNRGHEPVDSSS